MSVESRLQALENIILNSKDGNQIPVAASAASADKFIFYNTTTQQTESITKSKLLEGAIGLWKYIEDSFVEKGAGNVSDNVLEVNDVVYFKKITNGATYNQTLIGHTYDGGDKDLETSYTQNQAMTT